MGWQRKQYDKNPKKGRKDTHEQRKERLRRFELDRRDRPERRKAG